MSKILTAAPHVRLFLTGTRAAGTCLRPKLSLYFSSYWLCELVSIYYVNPLARLSQKYCVLLLLDSMLSLNHTYRVSFWTCILFDLFATASGISVYFKIMPELYYYYELFHGLAMLWLNISFHLLLILITLSFSSVQVTILTSFSLNLCLCNKTKSGNFPLSQMLSKISCTCFEWNYNLIKS